PRNGYLLDGKGQLAVFDPHAARPARVVAGHDVDSEADKLGDVETVLHGADDFLRRMRTGHKVEVLESDHGRSGDAARRVAGGAQVELPSCVAVEKIICEHAFFDDRRRPGRNALVIEGTRAEPARPQAVIQNGDVLPRYPLAQLAGQE